MLLKFLLFILMQASHTHEVLTLIGSDLNSIFDDQKYEIFDKLLPEYITLLDIFDRNTDNSFDDSDEGKDNLIIQYKHFSCWI